MDAGLRLLKDATLVGLRSLFSAGGSSSSDCVPSSQRRLISSDLLLSNKSVRCEERSSPHGTGRAPPFFSPSEHQHFPPESSKSAPQFSRNGPGGPPPPVSRAASPKSLFSSSSGGDSSPRTDGAVPSVRAATLFKHPSPYRWDSSNFLDLGLFPDTPAGHFAFGEALGEDMREQIHEFVLEEEWYLCAWEFLKTDPAAQAYSRWLRNFNEAAYPSYFDELRGLAAGAGVDFERIWVIMGGSDDGAIIFVQTVPRTLNVRTKVVWAIRPWSVCLRFGARNKQTQHPPPHR